MLNVHNDSHDKSKNKNEVQEVDETDARYERMDKLGEGTYGIVYKSRDRETGEVSILRWLQNFANL